jgi:hypothetical protein
LTDLKGPGVARGFFMTAVVSLLHCGSHAFLQATSQVLARQRN